MFDFFIFIFFLIFVIALMIWHNNNQWKKVNGGKLEGLDDNQGIKNNDENPGACQANLDCEYVKDNRMGLLKRLFCTICSYREIRIMFVVCFVIWFASHLLGSTIQIKMKHDVHINHDFGGNSYKPIVLELSDRNCGPVRVQVTHSNR